MEPITVLEGMLHVSILVSVRHRLGLHQEHLEPHRYSARARRARRDASDLRNPHAQMVVDGNAGVLPSEPRATSTPAPAHPHLHLRNPRRHRRQPPRTPHATQHSAPAKNPYQELKAKAEDSQIGSCPAPEKATTMALYARNHDLKHKIATFVPQPYETTAFPNQPCPISQTTVPATSPSNVDHR